MASRFSRGGSETPRKSPRRVGTSNARPRPMSNSEKPYVIVVGVDYSPASDLALERAFELGAERPQAEVHVVNVVRLYGSQALVDGAEPPGFAAMSLSEATAQL